MADRYLHGSTQVDNLTDGSNTTTISNITSGLSSLSGKVNKSGDSMTGDLTLSKKKEHLQLHITR